MNFFKFKECYVGFLNMDHRTDRLESINYQLGRFDIIAERTRGKHPEEIDDGSNPKYQVMWNRTKGALACHYGQVEIMQKALSQNKDAIVFEDDIILCEDFDKRIEYIERFINEEEPNFDIFWLGGTVHINPSWWHVGGKNADLPATTLMRDAEQTNDPRIIRTYGAFCTYAYIVNKNSIQRVLDLLEENVHLSMGIDWDMIKIQPQLKTYMMLAGSVKQMDNKSDIGQGDTIFSGFSMLGDYWYQERMEDFNPHAFDFGEAKK